MWRACSTHGDVARETLERARVLGGGAVRRKSGLTTNVWLRTTTTRADDSHGDHGDEEEEWTPVETRATTVIASRMCDGDDGATDGASATRTYESNALGLSDARACAFVDEDCLVVVSSDGSACAVIEDVYGEGKVRAVESASLTEVKGAKSRVTRAESCEAGGGKASVAVGDSNGNLYCVSVDCGAGKFTWSVFDRSNRSDWVDDMHDDDEDEEEDAEASVLGSPTKTPGKTRRWGALRSATMAAGALLSRKVNAGGIRSLRFAQGSSESKKRLLACEASGTIEEWSLDMSGAKEPTLAHTHKVSKMIKRVLRVSSNVTLISADWIVTETGVDISVLAECDGKGPLHRPRRTHGTNLVEERENLLLEQHILRFDRVDHDSVLLDDIQGKLGRRDENLVGVGDNLGRKALHGFVKSRTEEQHLPRLGVHGQVLENLGTVHAVTIGRHHVISFIKDENLHVVARELTFSHPSQNLTGRPDDSLVDNLVPVRVVPLWIRRARNGDSGVFPHAFHDAHVLHDELARRTNHQPLRHLQVWIDSAQHTQRKARRLTRTIVRLRDEVTIRRHQDERKRFRLNL